MPGADPAHFDLTLQMLVPVIAAAYHYSRGGRLEPAGVRALLAIQVEEADGCRRVATQVAIGCQRRVGRGLLGFRDGLVGPQDGFDACRCGLPSSAKSDGLTHDGEGDRTSRHRRCRTAKIE